MLVAKLSLKPGSLLPMRPFALTLASKSSVPWNPDHSNAPAGAPSQQTLARPGPWEGGPIQGIPPQASRSDGPSPPPESLP